MCHKLDCSPNPVSTNDKLKSDFLNSKPSRGSTDSVNYVVLTDSPVDDAISKISNFTTPGHDHICIEHFKLAHPSVTFIFTSILNIFISLGQVPSDFGLGLVTPIPKFKGNKLNVKSDDFRGITLNVIASKIFEHCLLPFLSNLTTSARQFEFKKGLDCVHAINRARNTAQFF